MMLAFVPSKNELDDRLHRLCARGPRKALIIISTALSKGDDAYWYADDPALSRIGSFDADHTHQHPHCCQKCAYAEE